MNNMKQQTFEEYLQERHAAQYHGTDDDMSDDFDGWLVNLEIDKFIEYADRWGKESNSIYLINTLTNIIQNHEQRKN